MVWGQSEDIKKERIPYRGLMFSNGGNDGDELLGMSQVEQAVQPPSPLECIYCNANE